MPTITDNERKVLRALLTNDFGDGIPGAELWADCINSASEPSGIEGKALSGVVSSLARKELVGTAHDGRDAVIWLTKTGIRAAQQKA